MTPSRHSALLPQRPDRYLHCPRLVSGGDSATLSVIAWQGGAEHLLQVELGPHGEVGAERALPGQARIVTLTRGDAVAPTDDPCAELAESRAGLRVWATHAAGVGSVLLSAPGRQDVLVFRAHGCVAAPCLAPAPLGTWVAFHHDVREDDGRCDVAKWIAVRFVDRDGRVFMPQAQRPERDLLGVEQSFELPALVVRAGGALSVFGRGSHNYFRQDLNGSAISPRTALGDGTWGARGRHIAAARLRDAIVVARRERAGIAIDWLDAPAGEPPALVPARVDHAATDAEPRRPSTRALASAARDVRSIWFGDLQQHTAHSDGLGTADEAYLRARYRYGDDFVAVTDHESFLGKRTSPGEWEYLQRVADAHDEPGAFVTLHAYEWTGKAHPGPGHKCVYHPRRGLPIVSRDDVAEGGELGRRVRALGGFAAPHHIGWTGADEPGHDDDAQPLWEICSCHGCYEHEGHPLGQRGELREQMIDTMLRRGHRFGFCASSDSHGLLWHHGESRKRDPYRTGLTGVLAPALTREAIFEALRARRCYATSGAKILLSLTADGAPMGSELSDRDEAAFEVHARGTATIASLALVGMDGVLAEVTPLSADARLRATAASPFVYARVRQADGEMAWSSPVFLGPKRAA